MTTFIMQFKTMIVFALISIFSLSTVSAQKGKDVDWKLLSANKNATFYEVQKSFETYWADKKPSKGTGYNVYKRWENLTGPRVFPSGDLSLPSSNYENFLKWKKKNKASFLHSDSRAGNWTELGPMSKPSGYDAGVGRVDFVKFDPLNSDIVYVSTPDGGLWKTTNGNDSLPNWTTNNDYLAVIGCSDLAIHPTNTKLMYLATGSWESDKKSIGVFKSTDGGANWETTSLVWEISENFAIRRLIMDPTNPLVMLAATDGGVYRTTDGWATYSITGLTLDYNIDDIKFKNQDHMTVYATGRSNFDTDIFWKSTDNGVSWTPVTSGLPLSSLTSRNIMATTAADNDYVYLLAGNTDGGYQGLYRSTNSGTSYTTQSTSPNILNTDIPASDSKGQATHDLAIAVSPTNKNDVLVGGINQWRSADGGVTWTVMTYWHGIDPNNYNSSAGIAPYLHADVQSIQFLPGSSTTIFTSCDGGISKSTDNGVSWIDLSNNLRIAQQNDVALSADDSIMITGLQDIGNLKNSSGPWTYIGGGDGEGTFIDRTNKLNIVVSDPNGDHSFSDDAGVNTYTLNGNGLPEATEFYSPILQDPVVSTTCYAAGRPALYICENYQDAPWDEHVWTAIGTPSGSGSVLDFVVAPSNTSIIYTIKEDAVSKTVNGGTTWTNVTGSLPMSNALITNIAISNTDSDKVWVTFSGYSATTKVFKTTNGGTSWTDVNSEGLPNIPINTIVYKDDDVDDAIYIGADIGVYYLDNTSSNWVPYFNDLAHAKVTDLEIYYPTDKLRAATYGRGLWQSDLYNANTHCSITVTNTNDEGLGSLRRAIACAVAGDTILFAPSLTDGVGNDTILLTSGRIQISKDINILQTPATKVMVKAQGPTGPIFRVAGSQTLSLRSIDLYSGTNMNSRALQNDGTLILEDVDIYENVGNLGVGTTFTNLGKLQVLGNVNIIPVP